MAAAWRMTVPVLHQGHGDKGGEDGEGGKALSEGRSTDVCTHTASSEERQRHRRGPRWPGGML